MEKTKLFEVIASNLNLKMGFSSGLERWNKWIEPHKLLIRFIEMMKLD